MNAKELLAEWEKECVLPELSNDMKVSARLGFLSGLVASSQASNPAEAAAEAFDMIQEMARVAKEPGQSFPA